MQPSLNNPSKCQAVIFDLDGTLVDSSAGILHSLAHAFSCHGIKPLLPLEPSLIGPPLRETINALSTEIDTATSEAVIESFKGHYDSIGYRMTTAYEGISSLLSELSHQGVSLAIVTNKRDRPTKSILQELSWHSYFTRVYSPDSIEPASPNKSHLIKLLLDEMSWQSESCLYIGDRIEDWHAARANNIRFGWADWGFSKDELHFDDDSFVLTKPDLQSVLDQLR
jgi:phosphoglycolate phosphatase